MDAKDDPLVWNAWYVVGVPSELRQQSRRRTKLLGREIELDLDASRIVASCAGRILPVEEYLGYAWTTLGASAGPPQRLPEYYEPDRLVMNVFSTPIRCSGLRIVDNVVDNAHLPFVHPGVLGDAEHTELGLSRPAVEADGALWSRSQKAWLPLTNSVAEYSYRISDPYSVILCIHRPDGRFDYVAIFAQPLDEESFIVHKLFAWVREEWMNVGRLRQDQQWMAAQDKYVLERHAPKRLPLNGNEHSVSVDVTSVAYRNWLIANGVRYGAIA